MDHCLSLSPAEVLNFATPDLLRLLYAILMLGRFSSGLDAPRLDSDLLRVGANIGYYIDAVVEKFRVTLVEINSPTDHHLVYLSRMFADTKKYYRTATAGAIAITEDLFASTPKKLTEKPGDPSAAQYCVDIPDGYDSCPDFDSAFNKRLAASDPADLFINWDDMTA